MAFHAKDKSRCAANPLLQIYPDEPVGLSTNSLEESAAFDALFLRLDPSAEETYVKFWVDYADGTVRYSECGMDTVNPVYSGLWKKGLSYSKANYSLPKPIDIACGQMF